MNNEQEIIYRCPVCGEIKRWPLFSTSAPDIIHEHIGDSGQSFLVEMVVIHTDGTQ